MIRVAIERWDLTKAVWDWRGKAKNLLIQRLKTASPSMGHTERKRLVRQILDCEIVAFDVEDAFYATSMVSFLGGMGAVVHVSREDAKAMLAAIKSTRNAVPS